VHAYMILARVYAVFPASGGTIDPEYLLVRNAKELAKISAAFLGQCFS